jgi:hypothetical protein
MITDRARGQRIFGVPAQRRRGRQSGGRREQPHRRGWHGVGEWPARCRAGQDQPIDSLRAGDGQLLGYHAAQARPHDVGPADACGIEHGNDIAGHVAHGK